MKAMFSVEEDGSVAAEIATESQGLLAEFVDFIKARGTVCVCVCVCARACLCCQPA